MLAKPLQAAAASGLGLMLFCITFWTVDLAIELRMTAWRSEAGAMALSMAPPRVEDSRSRAAPRTSPRATSR